MERKNLKITILHNLKWGHTLILLFFISSISFAVPNFNLRETVGNILLFPLASSSTSDITQEKAKAIAQQLAPKSQVTVRNLNILGRLLIGYKNTLSIPFINYVLVNEKWLQTLMPKAEEFVLARSMLYILCYPYEYSIYKYVFPILLYNLCKLLNEYITQFSSNISPSKKQLICYFTETILSLLKPYYLRKIEYQIDAKAVTEFNCFDGAVAALTDSIKFSAKGSTLIDQFNAKFSGIEAIDLALNLGTFYARFNPYQFGFGHIVQKILSPITIAELTFPLTSLLSPQFLLGGRFTDRQSTFFNFIKNLPLINLFFDYPKPYKRIKAITDMKNKMLKLKLKEEKIQQNNKAQMSDL